MNASDSQAQVPRVPPCDALAFRVVRYDHIEPDREQIHRLLGLQPGRDQHQPWFELVDRMLIDLRRLMRPRGVFRIDEVVAVERRRITLKSGTEFNGSVGAFLKDATLVATFVVTIGSAVERLSRGWLKAGKIMAGTVADAIASEAAEATGARLQDDVRGWARAHGLEITPRYSPGYCGMTVREQLAIFARLPAGMINVRLTPSCLMVPLKSISGLIGLGPADKVSPDGYACEFCDHPDCVQRRAAYKGDAGQVGE